MLKSMIATVGLTGILFFGGVEIATAVQSDVGQAVVAIDVDFAKMRGTAIGQAIDEAQKMSNEPGPQKLLGAATRITAAISAPADLQSIMMAGQVQASPIDFYVQIAFQDAQAKSEAMFELQDGFEATTENGKKVWKPKQGGPTNVRLVDVGSNAIEIATVGYLQRGSNNNHSAGLTKTWKALPDHPIRLAADFDSARGFLDEAYGMLSAQAPPEAAAYIDMLNQVSSLTLTGDPVGNTILSLNVVGRDEKTATEFHQSLDGTINMARLMSGQAIAEIKTVSPKLATAVSSMIASLKAVKNGNNISVNVPRVEGLDAALEEGLESARKSAQEVRNLNRFRQAALAVHNYHESYGGFPFAPQADGRDSQDMSWRVRVLPYFEQSELSEKIDRSDRWDSSANKAFHNSMPQSYGTASQSLSDICYVAPAIPVTNFADISDGTSNSVMFLQNPAGVPWMKPQDLSVDEAVALVSKLPEGGSLIAAFYDGSVRKLKSSIPVAELKKLFDPADGLPLNLDD